MSNANQNKKCLYCNCKNQNKSAKKSKESQDKFLSELQCNIVEDRVKKIVSDQLGKSVEEIQSDSSFVDDLGADSLDTVELVMALEEEFDLEIADEDAEKISTVNEAVEYINSNS